MNIGNGMTPLAPLPATSFNALDPSERVEGLLFLEASAGTGKTFAIEHAAVRLICENGIPLEKILVVTFTRAAARELKERLILNIEAALDQLTSGRIELPYLKEGGIADKESRLKEALQNSEAASIFTIHSFCQRSLIEFAFEAKSALSFPDPTQGDGNERLLEEVYHFLRAELTPDLIHPAQLRLLLKGYRSSIERLAISLMSLASHPPIAEARPYAEIEADFNKQRPHEPLLQDFLALSLNYKELRDRNKELKAHWVEQVEALERGEFAALLGEDNVLSKLNPENLTARGDPTLPPTWRHLVDQVLPLVEEATSFERIQSLIASRLAVRLDKVKEALDLCTPDDLILKMRRALQREPFVAALREKYRAVIIDEFQDTDEAQWDIFKTLFLHPTSEAFLLVGDPKQSIYSFRGADLNVYFEAKRTFGDERVRSLDTNFRSDPQLVDALNQLFTPPNQSQWLIEGSFHPVKAGRTQRHPNAGIELITACGKRHHTASWPTREVEEHFFFPFIINEIIEKQYALKDVVILIKDRYQGMRLENALRKASLPVLTKGVKPLSETPAFNFLENLFLLLDEPNHPSHLKRFLGHALMPYGLKELCQESDQLLWPMTQIRLLQQILADQGLGPFFKALFDCQWQEGKASFFQQLELQDYGDLQRLSEIIIEEGDPHTALEGIARANSDWETRYRRVGLADSDAITIMTMHMSKGLEFPIVFALGCTSRHREDGTRSKAEEMRGLYVALTRAKFKLYIPLALEEERKTNALSSAELFFTHYAPSLTLSELEEALTPLMQNAALKLRPLLAPLSAQSYTHQNTSAPHHTPFTRTLTPEPYSSFSALARHTTRPPLDPLAPTELPLGAGTGLQLHALFEKAIISNLYGKPRLKTLIRDMFPDHTALVEQMVDKAFTLELVPGLRLADVSPSGMAVELEMLYRMPHLAIKGFADLVLHHKGRYYIIDWKSNYLQDYAPAALESAMHDNDYFFQAALYAEALRLTLDSMEQGPFDQLFGGVIYIFLRGLATHQGVIHFIPDLTHLQRNIDERAH